MKGNDTLKTKKEVSLGDLKANVGIERNNEMVGSKAGEGGSCLTEVYEQSYSKIWNNKL